jgi:hypothetical protein
MSYYTKYTFLFRVFPLALLYRTPIIRGRLLISLNTIVYKSPHSPNASLSSNFA